MSMQPVPEQDGSTPEPTLWLGLEVYTDTAGRARVFVAQADTLAWCAAANADPAYLVGSLGEEFTEALYEALRKARGTGDQKPSPS